jgi:hypothetical protein
MYFLRDLRNEDGEYDYKLYVISFIIFAVNTMIDLTRATSVAAFMARVSDESIGGTYMTFLTTLGNLGKLLILFFKSSRLYADKVFKKVASIRQRQHFIL